MCGYNSFDPKTLRITTAGWKQQNWNFWNFYFFRNFQIAGGRFKTQKIKTKFENKWK